MRFTYRVIDVYADDRFWLLFTGDLEIAKTDQRCWACFQREPGVATSALDFLFQAWSNLTKEIGSPPPPEPRDS